jgi:hypothetical protein
MGRSTWTGPIRAGSILNTSGSTLGRDVANVGFVVMTQWADITQAGLASAAKTGIVIPANSTIISMKLFSSTAFDGSASTVSFGTTSTATELVSAGVTSGAVGLADLTPGTNATRVGVWKNVGTTDIAIWGLAANTGAGVGRLIVQYIQNNN